MRGSQVQRIDQFSGGLDYREGGRQARINGPTDDRKSGPRVREALNVICDRNGVLRRRSGFTTSNLWNTRLFTAIYIVGSASTLPNNARMILSDGVANFWTGNPANPFLPLSDITGLAIPGDTIDWIEAPASGGQGPLYGLNPGGGLEAIQWTGTGDLAAWTATTGSNTNLTYRTTVPNAQVGTYFQGRMFVANDGTNAERSTVWWSNTIDDGGARVWPNTSYVRLDPQDGDQITALASLGQSLIVFKRNKVYQIYDTATGANRLISSSIGAMTKESVVVTPSGVIFYSHNAGVCITDGRTVTPIGDPVKAALDLGLESQSTYFAGAYMDGHYYICGGRSPVVGRYILLDLDLANQTWWAHAFEGTTVMRAMAVMHQAGTVTLPDQLFMISAMAPVAGMNAGVYRLFDHAQMSDGTVGGSLEFATAPPMNYTSEVRTQWQDFGAPHLRKRLRRLRITGRGGLDVQVSTDYNDTSPATLVSNGLGAGIVTSAMLDVPVNDTVGNAFSVRLSGNDVADRWWAVQDMTAAVTMRKN